MNSNLVIVQNKPTQFDVPLYAYLKNKPDINLKVIYTDIPYNTNSRVDPEIGIAPYWDHLNGCEYTHKGIRNKNIKELLKIANQIALGKPKLVIISGYFPIFHLKLAIFLKTKKIRIGLRSDNTFYHSDFSGYKGAIKRLFLPFLLNFYDTWHPVGTLSKSFLEKMSKKKPTFLFPYNVDNHWFEVESSKYRIDRDTIRAKMGFSSNDFLVLGIMKWHEREDPVTLLDAFGILKDRHENARLVLVGDGPLRDVIIKKTKNFGNSAILPGYIPYSELPKFYSISDVFVHPAVNEPWGVSVNEAMACGIPVIAAEGVGSHVDLITKFNTGAVFPNKNSSRLSEIISKIIYNHKLLIEMGKAAKSRVLQWNYEQTYNNFLSAIKG